MDHNQAQQGQTSRHSSRQSKMTEKGKCYKQELLLEDFYAECSNLKDLLAETDSLLLREEVNGEDLMRRRREITGKLEFIKEISQKLKELGDEKDKIEDDINEVNINAVSTMNKIIVATKHLHSLHPVARSFSSHESRRSRVSTRSSVGCAAETAALQEKLKAQSLEIKRVEQMEQMEHEERLRRIEADRKLAQMKRDNERKKLEEQLQVEEVRMRVLKEEDGIAQETNAEYESMSEQDPPPRDDLRYKRNRGAGLWDSSVSSSTSQTNQSLAEALTGAITLSRLPIPEPPIFSGDSLQYSDWLFSFTSLIENKGVPPAERIHFLKRYLGGPAREAVSGLLMLRSESAYQQAREILEQRFGNPFVIAEAFRSRLDRWPKVQNRDKTGLRRLSDFLLQCLTASKELEDLRILNDIREIKTLTSKLPDWMVHRWNRITALNRREQGRYPNFQEFAQFVAEESEIMNDPVLSSVPMLTLNGRSNVRQGGMSHSQGTVLSTNRWETPRSPLTCAFCKMQNHSLHECRDFIKTDLSERKDFIKREGLCFGCLKQGHMSRACTNRSACKECKRKHPTCLHDFNQSFNRQQSIKTQPIEERLAADNSESNDIVQLDGEEEQNAICRKILSLSEGGLTSMVVPVYLSDEKSEHEILVYALLDTMSDSTFILDTVAEELQAHSEPAVLKLTTMTDNCVTVSCQKYMNLRVRGFHSQNLVPLPVSYSRSQIPLDEKHIPSPQTASRWPHLRRLESLLAPKQNCPVGLLIGYNCPKALAPINCITGEGNQPYAVETELGWSIVGGKMSHSESFDSIGCSHRVVTQASDLASCMKPVTYVHKNRVKDVTATDLMELMEQDFKEQGSINETISQEDKLFLKILEKGIHQRPDGYYEMPLPFRNGEPDLPKNRNPALQRAAALKKQLHRRPRYLQHYATFMAEILERGDAERIPDEEMDNPSQWYIPHHGVYHPQKPERVRVVFDCSARYQGSALNDHLLQGPDLINSLVGVLCRFREGPVAFTCDVEKMYHQFRVIKSHQDYLRFLWWEDGDLSRPLSDYRMKVHLFGATSSPGCANFALKHLAMEYKGLGEQAASFLQKDFYVDDGLKAEFSAEAAIDVLHKARLICQKGNLRLHKVVSNSMEVMNSVPESERGTRKITSLEADLKNGGIERTLGLQWCTNTDTFCFKLNVRDKPRTRRGILATVASVYDPLGLIAPVIFGGKQILQSVCKEQRDWDCPIPEDLNCQWERWKAELGKLSEVKIPRCYQPEGFGTPVCVQLHHFSDASLLGYGQCSYVRLENRDGDIHCRLVLAKSRVAPLKAKTIPRLELQAAVLSVHAAKFLETHLNYPNMTHHYWTDSKVVLGYIQNETARFYMYVANRVERIRQNSQPKQWNYVSTEKNPADHVSRGLSVERLLSSDWFTGPAFLWKSRIEINPMEVKVSVQDVEVRSATVLTTQRAEFTRFEDRVARFSSFQKVVGAVSMIIGWCKGNKNKQMSSIEIRQIAERNLIRAIQREAFDRNQCELKSSPLKTLDPFFDEDNLLRVGGRLRKMPDTYGVKHPVILPRKSHLSYLIASYCHEKIAHQGRSMTINEIRSRGYWIMGCRSLVSSLIHKCVTCIRLRGKGKGQKMADLPRERIEPSPPFTYCGLDCFGPFIIKEGRREMKKYGLIVTCLAVRAIHIEVLDDLTTDSFINGLRCFIALRGKVRTIYCDQGSNFVGASHELKDNLKGLDQKVIISRLLSLECEFKFNPPSSSHMGGVWERQIRNVRNILKSILGHSASRLDTSSLRTLMYEAMAIVNSRPLTTEGLEEADGPLPLTPNHLLTMKSGVIVPPPPGTFEREDVYLRKRWRRVQVLVDMFWIRWKKEYLQTLQGRNTWQRPQQNVNKGDIVLLQDEGICRTDWRMARVVETFPSEDGLVRKVKLLMAMPELNEQGKPLHKKVYLERPVHKLVVLLSRSDN